MTDKKTKGEEVTSEKPMLTVVRSINNEDETVEEDHIEVQPFESEVARVSVSKGLTVNMGNYESARVDVTLSLPCYPEEVVAAIGHVDKMVEGKLMLERDALVDARDAAKRC